MFLDILMTNRPAVLAQLDAYMAHLSELRTCCDEEDEAQLSAKLAQSQANRATWKANR